LNPDGENRRKKPPNPFLLPYRSTNHPQMKRDHDKNIGLERIARGLDQELVTLFEEHLLQCVQFFVRGHTPFHFS